MLTLLLVKGDRETLMKNLYTAQLGKEAAAIDEALTRLERERVIPRIWRRDHRVWSPEPAEISNRLAWLDVAERMAQTPKIFTELAEEVRIAGYDRALLLGMGGSSLAPEMFRLTFGVMPGFLDLSVIDTTDPAAVLAWAEAVDPARTLWLVASKSGGTVETLSQLKFFYRLAANALGPDRAGEHFVAITDPGSKLADLARQGRFRATVLGDPDIGGRFSALSPFGLAPAALLGLDLSQLLLSAREMAVACGPEVPARDNPAARLGLTLAELARRGRDKLTLVIPEACQSFGDWVEQLVAESTGKEGRGILPVVNEPLGPPSVYGDDRVFVQLCLPGDPAAGDVLESLARAGHPVIRLEMGDLSELSGQIFLWELATAVMGAVLGINPFDQPNVEAAKVAAREVVAAYHEAGALPDEPPALEQGDLKLYGQVGAADLDGAIAELLEGLRPPGYLAIQAFLPPSAETSAALEKLRVQLRDRRQIAVTVGYGPRFLHSTGQLHKGDAGRGRFLQLTADSPRDAGIPDGIEADGSSLSFGVLEAAQARGDRQALVDAGRPAICLHLGPDIAAGLDRLDRALG